VAEFVADGRRGLWLGSSRSGLAHVSLAEDFSRILELRRYSDADGIEYGTQADAIPIRLADGRLIVSTGAGFFEHQQGHFKRTGFDGLEALRADGETLRIAQAPNGGLWAYSYRHIFRHDASGWHGESVHGLTHGAIEALTFASQGQALFSSGDGVLRHESIRTPVSGSAPQVLLTRVEQHGADGGVTALPLDNGTPLVLPAGGWSLVLRFALPDLSRPDAVRYQWRLGGAQTRFTDWTTSTTLNYSGLAPGDYRLEVNGRDSQGRISAIAPLTVRVMAPWYARTGMIAVWILLALALAAASTLRIVQVRTQRLQREHAQLECIVAQRTAELETANRRLDNMAHLDGLTGIANRRRLDDFLPAAWENSLQRQRPLSLLIVDVDHFKEYNDSNGHLAGDALLAELGQVLQSGLRRSEDLLARYGGDEFFVVLPGADSAQAMDVASHMRELLASSGLDATVSIGTATLTPGADTRVTDLIDRADAALYAAKNGGRDRIVAQAAIDRETLQAVQDSGNQVV
jgi:diguanylate cyclase (GGDEF)-like protein